MTRFYYYPPNAMIYGASLKIQNTSDVAVDVYGDAGVYITYGGQLGNGDPEQEFPLVTASQNGVTTVPANATVWISNYLPAPIKPDQQVRIAIDTTSLPSWCVLTPVVHIGRYQNEVKGTVV